ncbi:MAG TPA: ribosomal protein S18-alanine N-acetyltransferase, partial [Woeseiaceae bacterium]|nr:ribosomal protein S18-alanine N-acetyltransferase [Woeseiaceae bacterium]
HGTRQRMSAVAIGQVPGDAPATRMRPMRDDDLDLVLAIELRAYPFPWTRGIFEDCLRASYPAWVLQSGDDVIGYGVLSIAAGEAHVLNLCVDPDYRNQGYGDRLLDDILLRARQSGVKEVFLEVRPSNVNALSLYRKKGFRQVASRHAYYQAKSGREDAAVLSLVLKHR